MLSVEYKDLFNGTQDIKKRFDSIRVDLQYLSYTAEALINELRKVAVEIEDLGNDIEQTDIIL